MVKFKGFSISILIATFIAIVVSCSDTYDEGMYVSQKNTMVCAFQLAKDTSVLHNLDSIFFSIDLANSIIYNADSLPKGTDISDIGFYATFYYPQDVIVSYESASGDVKTFSYLLEGSTRVDFSKSQEGKVKMEVISSDGSARQTYTLKLNVHKVVADSLYWKELRSAELPLEASDVISEKCVSTDMGYYMFAQMKSGDVKCLRTANFESWEEKTITSLPEMKWRTLLSNGANMYVLSNDNKLYVCSDLDDVEFVESASFGEYKPVSLVGMYENLLLAVVDDNGTYKHASLPIDGGEIELSDMPSEFPVSDFSQPVLYTSKWTQPQLIIACGEKRDGSLTNAVWGFDGKNWAILNANSKITPRKGANMFTYYTYEYDSQTDVHVKKLTYFLIGGWDGEKMTNDLFYTTSLAGRWNYAGKTSPMYLPESILPRMYSDAFVIEKENVVKSQRDNTIWRDIELVGTKNLMKVSPQNVGNEQQTVPYIYMVGGSSSLQYSFINEVWEGVIWRLTFPPIH